MPVPKGGTSLDQAAAFCGEGRTLPLGEAEPISGPFPCESFECWELEITWTAHT